MPRTVVYDRIVAPAIHAVRGGLRVRIEALDRQARIAVDIRERLAALEARRPA
jgi:hypothetical protein